MKMNIVIDLDDFRTGYDSEDGMCHSGSIEDAIIQAAAEMIVKQANKKITEELDRVITKTIEAEAVIAMKDVISRTLELGVCETNSWGEPTGKRTPFREYLVRKLDTVFSGRVDSNGNPSTYSSETTVIQWVIEKLAATELRNATSKIREDVKAAINDEIAKRVGSSVTDAVISALKK